MEKDLKIKDIVNKLKELSCSIVTNGNDVWLHNVLLKPGFERYTLVEWFLKKLEMNIEDLENLNSMERKTQSLLDICCSLGFCSVKDSDIIEGTAPVHKQIFFWHLLCNSLHNRNSHFSLSIQSENSDLSEHERYKSEQYNCCQQYVSKVCESINLSHIFKSKLQLFPSYLSKEIKSTLRESGNLSFSDDIIKKTYSERCGLKTTESSYDSGIGLENKSLELNDIDNVVIPHEKIVMELEDDISRSLCNLQNLQADSFSKAHDNLRLYFPEVTSNDFTDIGPAFKLINEKLTSHLMFKNSASSLSCCDSELKNLTSDLASLKSPPEVLSDSKLGEYIRILSEIKCEE